MKHFPGFTSFILLIVLASSTIIPGQAKQNAGEIGYTTLITNHVFLYSRAVHDFDVQAFLETMPGPLKSYAEPCGNTTQPASEIIRSTAVRYGLNPQVILVLLEANNGLLTGPNSAVPKASSTLDEPTFANFVSQMAVTLLTSYDGRRYHQNDDQVFFANGEAIPAPQELNAATFAVQMGLAHTLSQSDWEAWVKGAEPRFKQYFDRWFGNSTPASDQLPAVQSTLPSGYILPFTVGETWYLTSGPHYYYGGVVGCVEGDDCLRPWSSIDIAPPDPIYCPGGETPLDRWVVAARGGTVTEAAKSQVVIDHGDGWLTYYYHIDEIDMIGKDADVDQGDPIGHPSCDIESGGKTDGVHVHFAIYQEGVGFAEIASSSFTSWLVQETTHYNGTMSRNGATRVADTGRIDGEGGNDIINNETLVSDIFSDGNFDGWTVVDAPDASESPSNWRVVSAKGSLVLLQDSNIHTKDLPYYEGTYVYTGENTWSNYTYSVDVNPDDNDGVFVLFRYVDDDNFYRFFMDRERHYRRLEKKVDGVYTTLVEDLTTGYGDGWINIRIIAYKDTLKVELDYKPIFTVSDEAFSAGKIGLGTWGSTDCYFDNIIVAIAGIDPYADAVISSNIMPGSSGNQHTDVNQILGRPNGSAEENYVSLGGPGYWIVVDMGAGEEIIDKPGYDFRVYEIGRALGGVDEDYDVWVASQPDGPWTFLDSGCTTSEFDLAGSGLSFVRYVKIEDTSTRTSIPTPGSDLDAVQSLSMVGDVLLNAPDYVAIATVSDDILLSWSPVDRAVEYVVYFSLMSDGVGFDKLATVPISSTSFTHSGAADKDYTYVITAVGPDGYESGFSQEVPYIPKLLFLPLINHR